MTDERQLDPIEARLTELTAGERAGVFHRTSVSEAEFRNALRGEAPSSERGISIPKWGSIAAAIVVVLGAWSYIATVEINAVRERQASNGPAAMLTKSQCREQGILNCVGGPTRLAMAGGECAPHDYDEDGDVDLADFGAFQRRCQGVPQ